MQVCGQTEPGPQAIPHLQQSDAIEWGRPVSGSSDSKVRRLRRLPRYVHVDSAVIRKIAAATKLRPTRPQWVLGDRAGGGWLPVPEPRSFGGLSEHFKAVVKQQQNCQFKWHLRPGFQLTAGAPPATVDISPGAFRTTRTLHTRNDEHRVDGERTVPDTKHCTTQKFRGRFDKKYK